jgi:hypothetical protein
MKYLSLSIILFLSIQLNIYSQQFQKSNSLLFDSNYRIYPSNVNQSEVFIVTHPSNPDILFSSANTIVFNPFFVSEGIYVTTDGGKSWRGSDTCNGQPIIFHGGDPGITIDKNGTFILTRLSSLTGAGLYSHYSIDKGLTWSNQNSIDDGDLERATLASDVDISSSYFGRTYATWVKFAPPFPVLISYTDDGAQNWSSTIQINNPVQRSAGGEIAMGLNGTIFVCWAGVTELSPFTEDFVGLAYSNDGSNNWNVTENAFDMNGIAGQLNQKSNIRVNGLPRIAIDTTGGTRNGWIYIITTQKDLSPAGSDPDIILNRSIDGGQTWSSGIRVNQDQVNNGAIQYFPAVHVDKFGGLNVLFYDDRNTTSDSTGVFLARSDDGGDTWREFEISDHNFKPIPIGGLGQGYQGDNISITSSNEKLFPVWMDNSTGIYQIWTVPIEISSVDVENETLLPSEYSLNQNYPNPFNPSTKISWQTPVGSWQTLRIYDVLGNEVATLVDEYRPAGKHEIEFNTGIVVKNAASSIYFYQLKIYHPNGGTENFIQTKKMILLK